MGNAALKKLTYQDYLQIPEDNLRHEIIDGEHYVTPSPLKKHQRASQNINRFLDRWVEDHRLGEVYTAPFDVVLSKNNIVIPDLLFISKLRLHIATDKNIQGAPDLIVEILSPSTSKRDLGVKKKNYETSGVEYYWIVDPDQKTVQTFHLENNQYILSGTFTSNDTLTSSLFPGLSVSISSLFE